MQIKSKIGKLSVVVCYLFSLPEKSRLLQALPSQSGFNFFHQIGHCLPFLELQAPVNGSGYYRGPVRVGNLPQHCRGLLAGWEVVGIGRKVRPRWATRVIVGKEQIIPPDKIPG